VNALCAAGFRCTADIDQETSVTVTVRAGDRCHQLPELKASVDMSAMTRVREPADGDERSLLIGWLAFHRNALQAKCADLDAALDSVGAGNGYSVRWNLLKLIGKYSRHNGHADLLREHIDGQTGE
jgi:hypothetical protein